MGYLMVQSALLILGIAFIVIGGLHLHARKN